VDNTKIHYTRNETIAQQKIPAFMVGLIFLPKIMVANPVKVCYGGGALVVAY